MRSHDRLARPGRRPHPSSLIPPVLFLFLLGTGSLPLEGQENPPTRSQRHLAVGNIGFLGTFEPAFHGGYVLQFSFRPSHDSIGEFSETVRIPPSNYMHLLVSGGWGKDSGGGESGFSGLGQIGFLHRRDDGFFRSYGPVIIGAMGPNGFGPGFRGEFLHDNAALSVGWIFYGDDRADGVAVSLDLLACIFQDLGLSSRCLIKGPGG
jgi:hypothetical protein